MKTAPAFSLPDQDGSVRSLDDYAGRWLVLYFYPKDATPGCTKEACAFRDEREAIAELGNAVVAGISKDPVVSHKKFADKHGLNFPILSDESTDVMKAYGAWGKKKFMGREYEGTLRRTFIIDPKGRIVKEYPKVNPLTHAAEIIRDLTALQS